MLKPFPVGSGAADSRSAETPTDPGGALAHFGLRIRGLRWADSATMSIRVPQWACEDEGFWRLHTALLALQTVRPDAIASGVTAAYLHGLPVECAELQVAVKKDASRISHTGVRARRTARYSPVDIAGIRVQRLSAVLIELAEVLDEAALVGVIDASVGEFKVPPLAELSGLRRFVNAERSYRGRARLIAAAARAREGVRSLRETRLRLHLIDAGLPEPVVGHAVEVPELGGVIHPDLAYPAIKLAIEYEGDHHRTDPHQFGYDLQRYFYLERHGWLVLRVTKTMPLDWVADEVRAVLVDRGLM